MLADIGYDNGAVCGLIKFFDDIHRSGHPRHISQREFSFEASTSLFHSVCFSSFIIGRDALQAFGRSPTTLQSTITFCLSRQDRYQLDFLCIRCKVLVFPVSLSEKRVPAAIKRSHLLTARLLVFVPHSEHAHIKVVCSGESPSHECIADRDACSRASS